MNLAKAYFRNGYSTMIPRSTVAAQLSRQRLALVALLLKHRFEGDVAMPEVAATTTHKAKPNWA